MRKLFIDIGHSKKYPGAKGVMDEIVWNRNVLPWVRAKIDPHLWDVMIVPDNFGIWDWSANRQLINRINWINKRGTKDDYLVSLHANAADDPKVRGVTTCYMGGSDFAKQKASELSEVYERVTHVPLFGDGTFDDRTSRFGRIGMVRDTKPIALLIEMGFCTNPEDMATLPEEAGLAIAGWFNSF